MLKVSIALAVLLALGAPAVGAAAGQTLRTTQVTFPELGYADDTVVPGIYPSFTFNVPVSRTLSGAQLNLHVRVSPLADRNSSIKVLVNNVPIYATFVSQIGRDAHLTVPLPIPPKPQRNMQVTVKGYLFVTGDICYDLQTADLWMTVAPDSSLTMRTAVKPGAADIKDFFEGYGNRIVVVDPEINSLDPAALNVLRLPYELRQLEPWHQPKIVLAERPDPSARNIVIGPGNVRYDPATQTLHIDPRDLQLIDQRIAPLLVTPSVIAGSSEVNDPGSSPQRQLALSELGIGSQTASGLGEISFEYPIQANRFGGLPAGLQSHIAYAQTPLAPNAFGMLRVQLNGALIASRTLEAAGANDVWDVNIPASALSTSNDLRVIASYSTGPGSCRGNMPQLTITIDKSSYFSWSHLDRTTSGIADFLKMASGRVGVLIGDASMVPQAFHLLDEVGRLNGSIGSLTISKFDGTIPAGLDYAFVVAPPGQLQKLNTPLDLTSDKFGILNPLTNQTVFASTFGEPVGALELSTSGPTEVLSLSYWHSAAPLAHFGSYGIDDLSQQLGNIALFDGDMQTFQVGDKLHVFYASGDQLARIWAIVRLPVTVLLLLLVVAFVVFASRRLTGGGSQP